ncbi:hypothetical protein ATO6_18885 [Oceanicola sp. 22II-s10i]|uniref:hypothetical protein n=1 Tax=Oceanicola sp. 22II-s10i TaxID=1317116 RepID=UPI000B51F17E|nr:hypothetical protein [Oceanicola sp. 22II-s10i]OWU83491.1 hypothetical protein ATO6_18885 [Oceanicola sp. 22II-s10i]
MTQPSITRAALAADQKVAVSDADADRIERAMTGARVALEKVLTDTLFDTEPAHFDRYQIVTGTTGAAK